MVVIAASSGIRPSAAGLYADDARATLVIDDPAGPYDATALHLAARAGHTDVPRLLLDAAWLVIPLVVAVLCPWAVSWLYAAGDRKSAG